MGKAMTGTATAGAARRVQAVMVAMLMTLLAVVSLTAFAQPGGGERGPGWGMREHGHGSGMGGMGMGHGMHGGMHGGMGGGLMFGASPERIGRVIDHMLDGLSASDAQRGQIKQIAAAAAGDLKVQAEAARGLRQRAMQAFVAPNVDAAAVEQVRQQMLQQHDQMSRRAAQAMLDVARVLTPEQRARLGERMRDRQARMEERRKRMQDRMQRMEPPASAPPRR